MDQHINEKDSDREHKEYHTYIKKFFAGWAPYYDLTWVFISGIRKIVADFSDAKEGSRILDIATGTGAQAFEFSKTSKYVTGTDLSKDMLKVAKRKNQKRITISISDATAMPFRDNTFDIVCISFALHEMPESIRKDVLKELKRITIPKGALIIVDYSLPKNRLFSFFAYRLIRIYESRYYPGFIQSDFRKELDKSGIKVVKERSILFGIGTIYKETNDK
ncbi:MAG: class I SAM-dependent methyltransferase [archaeon]